MKKILTLVMIMLLMALSVVPAFAETSYTPVSGSCTFTTRLVMDAGDTAPNATFTYTITQGTAIPADVANNKMEVLAGVMGEGAPSITPVTFGPSDVPTEAGDKLSVSHTATVSFTGVSFDEPGIYRYVISQTANSVHAAAGIIHDARQSRILDVYVTDNGTGSLVVSSYVLHENASEVELGADMGSNVDSTLADKSPGFTNRYDSKDLKVSLGVTGNQASRDKYFAVTVNVANIADGDSYVVSLANDNNANTNDGDADTTTGSNSATIAANEGQTNAATVTGAQLKAGKTFYLQHGQSIVIRGLAPNATYTVTEASEDYKLSSVNETTGSGSIETVAGAGKMATVSLTNTRDGIIPTGIMVSVTGGVTLVAIAMAALFILGRKKSEDEE